MSPSSAKAKGRGLCKLVKDLILKYYPSLEEDDIKVTSSGATGEDLMFSPLARRTLPISIECKARNSIAVYEWLEQAKSNSSSYLPIVFAKGNHKQPIIIMDAVDFFDLITQEQNETEKNRN